MGAELPRSSGEPPRFLIAAAKDPNEANLDRIQVIKGWLDSEGELHEKIYNVAAIGQSSSGPRERRHATDPQHSRCNTCGYSNSGGAVELTAIWSDPDFTPEQRAFYYVRVIESSRH